MMQQSVPHLKTEKMVRPQGTMGKNKVKGKKCAWKQELAQPSNVRGEQKAAQWDELTAPVREEPGQGHTGQRRSRNDSDHSPVTLRASSTRQEGTARCVSTQSERSMQLRRGEGGKQSIPAGNGAGSRG